MSGQNLLSSRAGRLFFFGAMYFAQGVPWGFISVTLALYLTSLGLGPESVGEVLALSYLPWGFKPLMGPLADGLSLGRLGRRRPWILGAEIGMGLTLLALSGVDPGTSMRLFLGLILAHNVFAAAQDVGVDALAVEVLGEKERGTGNSVMWACKYGGVAVGGAGFSAIGAKLGWSWLFLVMAAAIFAIAMLPMMIIEPSREGPSARDTPSPNTAYRTVDSASAALKANGLTWRDHLIHGIGAAVAIGGVYPAYLKGGVPWAIWAVVLTGVLVAIFRTFLPGAKPLSNRVVTETLRSFAIPATFLGLLLVLLSQAGSTMLGPITMPLYKTKLGYSDEQIAWLVGLLSPLVSALGALSGGTLSDWIGRRRAIVSFAVATSAFNLAFGLMSGFWGSQTFVYAMSLGSALCEGMLSATVLSLCMDLSNPAVGGTQFTTYMAFANLKNAWASYVGGKVAAAASMPTMFVIGSLAQLVSLPLLIWVNPKAARARFDRDAKAASEPEKTAPQA